MISTKDMNKILKKLKLDTKELFDIYEDKRLFKTKKNLSEDISAMMENAISDYVKGSVAPKKDSEPDIVLECGTPVEIKTSSGLSWRGGTFSKRSGHFIFVNWELDSDNNVKFFIAGIDLIESDWKASKSKSYYATTYGKKELYINRDRVTFYCGEIIAIERPNSTILTVNLSDKANKNVIKITDTSGKLIVKTDGNISIAGTSLF